MSPYNPTPEEILAAMHNNRVLGLLLCKERIDDLVSAGNLAIMQSCKSYDPAKGESFASHAGHYIRRNQVRELTDICKGVHLPHPIADYPDKREAIGTKYDLDLLREGEQVGLEHASYGILNTPKNLNYESPRNEALKDVLREILGELSPKEMHLITLAYFEGKHICTLSRELHLTQAEIAKRIDTILAKLRKLFEETA